jgi:hypothetical protein
MTPPGSAEPWRDLLAEDGLERDADQFRPPSQPAEGELAYLLLSDAELLGRAVSFARRLEGLGDGRQLLVQRFAYGVGELGALAHGLAQEPDPVADVPGLIVVDLRVALDEPRQQPLVVQIVGYELERREPKGALDQRW